MTPAPGGQHCTKCGKAAPAVQFRSDRAVKCTGCDQKTAEERKEYHRLYHKARSRAIKRLIAKYPRLFEQMMAEETAAVQREEQSIDEAST